MITIPLSALLRSRKFLLAVFALIQSVVLYYLDVPEEIWQAINALVGIVIAGIALEDAAEKHGDTAVTLELPTLEETEESGGPV